MGRLPSYYKYAPLAMAAYTILASFMVNVTFISVPIIYLSKFLSICNLN